MLKVLCVVIKTLLDDGAQPYYQPDIYLYFECVVLLLRNMLEFIGNTQLLAYCTAPKEIVLFHDNGFVMLRSGCGLNISSIDG
jgi:hypothetical protein